jgi:hypothetical protein
LQWSDLMLELLFINLFVFQDLNICLSISSFFFALDAFCPLKHFVDLWDRVVGNMKRSVFSTLPSVEIRTFILCYNHEIIILYASHWEGITDTNNHNWACSSLGLAPFSTLFWFHVPILYSRKKLASKIISSSFYCQVIEIWLKYSTMKVFLNVICIANQIY